MSARADPASSGGSEGVLHLADALDVAREHVARREPALRTTAHADAARRAGENQVAGQQRRDGGQLLAKVRDAEDQISGAALLHLDAVDRTAEFEVIRVAEFVWRDEPRPDRATARVRLAGARRRGA